MNKRIIIVVVSLIALTGCEEGDIAVGTIKDYGTTASGAIHDAQYQFNDALSTGKSMIEDAKKRMDQVQSGVNLLMKGKEMIETGVSGEEE